MDELGFGNNPEPFSGDRCCDDCDCRFVIPMRLMMGRGENRPLTEFIRKMAELGRMMVETRRQTRAQHRSTLEVISGEKND
jgi:hypothetical protein